MLLCNKRSNELFAPRIPKPDIPSVKRGDYSLSGVLVFEFNTY